MGAIEDHYLVFYHQGVLNLAINRLIVWWLWLTPVLIAGGYAVIHQYHPVPISVTMSLLIFCSLVDAGRVYWLYRRIEILDYYNWGSTATQLANDLETSSIQINEQLTRFDNIQTVLTNSNLQLPLTEFRSRMLAWVLDLADTTGNLHQYDFDTNLDKFNRRARWLGIVLVITTPINVINMLIYIVISTAGHLYTSPSLLSSRVWKFNAKYKFRNINELDHQIEARLLQAYPATDSISANTASVVVSSMAKLINIGLVVTGLILVIDEQWSLAATIITGVIMVTKLIPVINRRGIDPELVSHLSSVLCYEFSSPTDLIETLDQYMEYRLVSIIMELVSVITTPWWLLCNTNLLFHKISRLIADHTIVSSIGTSTVRHLDPQSIISSKSVYVNLGSRRGDDIHTVHEATGSEYVEMSHSTTYQPPSGYYIPKL